MIDLSTMKDNETFYNHRNSNLFKNEEIALSDNYKNGRNIKIHQSSNQNESFQLNKNAFTPKLESKSPQNYTSKMFN